MVRAEGGQEFDGKRVTVMGLGGFGGGVGVARFLACRGARVTVTDLKSAHDLSDSAAQLAGLDVVFHLGGHTERDFTDTDAVIVNPAVPPGSPFLKLARDHRVALDTEMNIFFRLCPAAVAAVTGSDGKSTTTSLLAAMLACPPKAREKRGQRIWCGGNLGGCLLDKIDEIAPRDCVVLEISSFQLERLAWIRRSPHLAVVININPNHFDWHGTMEAYRKAKKNILRFQKPLDVAVLNEDDPDVSTWRQEARPRVFGFSARKEPAHGGFLRDDEILLSLGGGQERIPLAGFGLRGEHNRLNAAAAALAARLMGATPEGITEALGNFQPLRHRLELVGEVRGVRYYNDSKATTPVSALAALRSFDEPLLLIAGGHDKKLPFDEFGREAASRPKVVILLGEAADKIEQAIPAAGRRARVLRAADLKDAVHIAASLAQPGDVVLLSPACASYDMFRNYEERGDAFRALVERLARGGL
jgi:UDP-N-acetylmuramoylalanine--D-glutamate ligase